VGQVEVQDGDHVVLSRLEEGVADVTVHHVNALALGVLVPARFVVLRERSEQLC
jgi:hypothetical protein